MVANEYESSLPPNRFCQRDQDFSFPSARAELVTGLVNVALKCHLSGPLPAGTLM